MSTEPATIERIKHQLEALVDRMSLSVVLEALAEVCREKAEHVRAEWQDGATASWWDDKGDRIERVRERADRREDPPVVPCDPTASGGDAVRFTVIRGTDWRGDAYWSAYDNALRIATGPRFRAEAHARDYVESLGKK